MDLAGKQVCVVGLGKSGLAAARLCAARGASIALFDEATTASEAAQALDAPIHLGPLDAARLESADLVVVSPGVPPRAALDAAEAAGVPVIGELELASRFVEAPIVLIGGTNGKSTVTALVGAILEAAGETPFVGGNFGTPLSEAVGGSHSHLVVEISSFQAERVPTLRADVSALLNITEDHLDRYDSFASYADAKGNPFARLSAESVAVIPHGDPVCAAQAARGQGRVVTFSIHHADADVAAIDDELIERASGTRWARGPMKLRGRHNLDNACAAIAVARALGIDEGPIAQALATFGGLDHRAVLVGEDDGVRFYDDSKATNVGAAVAALSGLEENKAVLIAGGRDKHGPLEPLVEALRARGRALVLIGEAADRIAAAAEGVLPIERADSLEAAVAQAAALAERGDAVLLSPACSSFDMFTSYAHRGDAFVAAVQQRLGGTA